MITLLIQKNKKLQRDWPDALYNKNNIVYENEKARLLFKETCAINPGFQIEYTPSPDKEEYDYILINLR